ncbi:hypothetical protein [Streptomyces sp. NPDC059272]
MELPYAVPSGFHGSWLPETETGTGTGTETGTGTKANSVSAQQA